MKRIAIMLLSMGSIAMTSEAQQVREVIREVKCQKACCNPDRKKVVRKHKPQPPAQSALVAQPPAPTNWDNFRGRNPVVINGTSGGSVNVNVFFGDTVKREQIVTVSDIDRKVRQILDEEKVEKAVRNPYIQRTSSYVELLKKCDGYPLSQTRFTYKDFGPESSRKMRWKRVMKKTSLVPPAIIESDYLFASINSPYSKEIANVFNTEAGAIVITWVNEKTVDDPFSGHWVADFKARKTVSDDMKKNVRIFWHTERIFRM